MTKKILISLLMAISLAVLMPNLVLVNDNGLVALASPSVNVKEQMDEGLKGVTGEGSSVSKKSVKNFITDVVNILLYAIGAASVIMIIYGGFKYVTSAGDAGKVGEAKKTITYAVIGVIVAILAYAIVNFVITNFGPEKSTRNNRTTIAMKE